MTEPNLNPCDKPGYIHDVNIDPPSPYCSDKELDCDGHPIKKSQKDTSGVDFAWLERLDQEKTGLGQHALCDPMITGHIINDQSSPGADPNRTHLYRYSKTIRACDEAMMDMFKDIVVIDENNKAHQIPIVPATQEKAVAYILQENVRNDTSLVVDRIRLPIMAIHSSNISFDDKRYVYHKAIDYLRDFRGNPGFTIKERVHEKDTIFGVAKGIPLNIDYTLWVWTMHREDMNQIVEQIIPKITPMGYIRIQGVSYEIPVRSTSIESNIETDPGDKKSGNIFKYQFKMTVETYLSQPLVRKKAVLKTKMELVDSINDSEITEVLGRLESLIKELQ